MRKGRRAKRTLAHHAGSLKVQKRQAMGAGRGMDPCPEPESRAVLGFASSGCASSAGSDASGIVTRKGGNRQGSVSEANRARPVRETPEISSSTFVVLFVMFLLGSMFLIELLISGAITPEIR